MDEIEVKKFRTLRLGVVEGYAKCGTVNRTFAGLSIADRLVAEAPSKMSSSLVERSCIGWAEHEHQHPIKSSNG